ncbi:MAG: glycoside hydrolase family 2 TIM barrel-domain containing protein [Candidatus Bathyarchaeia archaeon]
MVTIIGLLEEESMGELNVRAVVKASPENIGAKIPIPPPRLPKRYLNSSRSLKILKPPEKRKRINNYESFRETLEKLKSEYGCYLENYTPPNPHPRPFQELKKFLFRYGEEDDLRDPQNLDLKEKIGVEVTIPDYRGPVGRWFGYYYTTFSVNDELFKFGRVFLCFNGVDYRCRVFINGSYVGSHEGFFAPFEFDVTNLLRRNGENTLLVYVENDLPTVDDGDKIYAATGPGWDEPGVGWHHCPPGAGIYQSVRLEGRPPIFISDVFVRPEIDDGQIEVWIEVTNTTPEKKNIRFSFDIYPRNFPGEPIRNLEIEGNPAGFGKNVYKFRIKMRNYRLWEPKSPYLYTLRCILKVDNEIVDIVDRSFGMRKFHVDEQGKIKGVFYLNNKRIFLRGANEMGHLQQCVMRGDYEQLFEDILIMKLANINFLRLTQRPVQPEIYDYLDALGIMSQTDFPIFGTLRRNLFEEALRQVGEMEKLIRSHPSVIMVSLINEPLGDSEIFRQKLEHRHLLNDELEEFFRAACSIIRFYNPDRIVKLVEGTHCGYIQERYVPWGVPDFHCYVGWYGPGIWGSIDELHRGYIYSAKPGWMTTCGEYGAEGLDSWETMSRYYPKDWIPEKPDEKWSPEKIPHSQTWLHHHSWFDTKSTLAEWVRESQSHQAWVIRLMTDAFRRRTDIISGFAVHLLIDAWPAGWLKTLVGVDRRPKPAYYEFADALTPLAVNIRTDRIRYFEGEKINMEFWIFNDEDKVSENLEIFWYVLHGDSVLFAAKRPARIKPSGAEFQGYFRWKTTKVKARTKFEVYLALCDKDGRVLHDYSQMIEVFPRPDISGLKDIKVAVVGEEFGKAWKLVNTLGLKAHDYLATDANGADIIICDSPKELRKNSLAISSYISNGGSLLLLEQEEACVWELPDLKIEVITNSQRKDAIGHIGLDFVSCATGHPIVKDFQPRDFSYWYDFEKDRWDYIARFLIKGHGCEEKKIIKSREMAVTAEFQYGKGIVIANQVEAVRRIPNHPIAMHFILNMLQYLTRKTF